MQQHTATTPLDRLEDRADVELAALAAEVDGATTPAVTAAAADYAVELHRAIVRILSNKRPHDADDIASMAVEDFLGLPVAEQHRIMVHRPAAVAQARLVLSHTAFDFDRDNRIQTCRGARLFDDGEGGRRPGRVWISGDAHFGRDDDSPSLFDLCASSATGDVADVVIDQLTCDERLEQLFAGVSPADRQLLLRVDGNGEQVKDIAAELGRARETLSRRISKIRAMVEENAARMKTGDMPTSTADPAPTRTDIP
jgi:DNA-directed RNA polymerase specialized sigma24 family protein